MVSLFCFLHACYNFIKIYMKQPALHNMYLVHTYNLLSYLPTLNQNYIRIYN